MRGWAPALALLALAVVAVGLTAQPLALSADLRALWMAGQVWPGGPLYPPEAPLFTMQAPPEWQALATAQGYAGPLYPYLYPPLWAGLAHWLPGTFAAVASAALWVNAALLAATVALAARASGTARPLAFAATALGLLAVTFIGTLGLLQGQPHLLVAFLLVLTVERARADAQIAAGIALGLAAGIKLFPALYAIMFLARGQWRALAAFAVTLAALAAASLALAGPALNQAFLDTLAQVSRTLLVTKESVSFDAVAAQLLWWDRAEAVGAGLGWAVMARPPLWSLAANAGLLLTLGATVLAARRAGDGGASAAPWAFALTASVLFLPIGWPYYLIPAAVFAPALMVSRSGTQLLVAGAACLVAARLDLPGLTALVPLPDTFLMVAGTLLWSAGFARAARPT